MCDMCVCVSVVNACVCVAVCVVCECVCVQVAFYSVFFFPRCDMEKKVVSALFLFFIFQGEDNTLPRCHPRLNNTSGSTSDS